MPSITPHLWFEDQAEEAAELYCSIFPNSRILGVDRFENSGPDEDQTVSVVTFEISGQRVMALNAGPQFTFDEAFSFYVECEDQAEVDRYWEALLAGGGQQSQCGWLKDRFGLSWQIIPKLLPELLNDPDPEKAGRVMHAMLQMVKIDCAALQRAYDGPVTV